MKKTLKTIILFLSSLLLVGMIFGAIFFCTVNKDYFSPSITVTFNCEDESLSEDEIKVRKNNCVSLPVLTKTGYDFLGWFCGDTKWEENTPIKENITLVAKFSPKKFKITFVVDEKVFETRQNYDSLPVFPDGQPKKEPTESTQFNFVRFEPELVKISGEATYTAIFEEVVRKFDVKITSNYENACVMNYESKVAYNTNANISLTENEGYRFVRYKTNDESLSYYEKALTLENVKSDINLIAEFELINYIVNFVLPADATHENVNNYNVLSGNIQLKEAKLEDYIFKGWFTNADGKGEKIEILSFDFVKTNPSLYAYFTQTITIKFVVDGTILNFDQKEVALGETVNYPTINTSKYGMTAYNIDGWYLTSSCKESEKYNFTTKVTDSFTLFGKWKYILGNGFYSYIDKFTNSLSSKNILIESEDEMIKFIEFVEFNNITQTNAIKIKFGTNSSDYKIKFSSQDDLTSYMNSLIEKSEFPNSVALSYTFNNFNNTLISIYLSSDISNSVGTLNADALKAGVTEQYEYPFLENTNIRNSSFDDFNINKVKNEISVSTSNQLVYVLEHGYKPNPVKNSVAEKIYNKAKSVLKQICNDSMTDFEKIKAIYDWMILNVQYDNNAANNSNVLENWYNYDAWYPEGVFFNNKAVCDGISKSLLILARIENIATIRVGGKHNGSGHAWNKVFIDGFWYGIDATHGGPLIGGLNSFEGFTYTSFLFTDEYKQKCCSFSIKDGTNASTSVNVYEKMTFGTGTSSFDLYINSMQELNNLVVFVKAYSSNESYYQGQTNHNYFTIEIVLAKSSNINVYTVNMMLGAKSFIETSADGNLTAYCFVIAF